MEYIKVVDAERKENPHKVNVKQMYNKDSAQAMHITLEPGQGLKPHITPVDVFFYILEGTPDILIGEETQTLEPDCCVDSPKDIIHCITNNSENLVRVLVVKAPKPTAKAKFPEK